MSRWSKVRSERAVRPMAVVVVAVQAEHALEVSSVDDQEPVEAPGADGADEALGDRVRLRRTHRLPIGRNPSDPRRTTRAAHGGVVV